MKNIETKIYKLTPGLLNELDQYLDYLINKKVVHKPAKLRQDWAGGLKDIVISSVELQKKALDWRKQYNISLTQMFGWSAYLTRKNLRW